MTKTISAATAAWAMGGFSYPNLCSNALDLIDIVDGSGPEWELAIKSRDEIAVAEEYQATSGSLFWHASHSAGGRILELDDDVISFDVLDWGVPDEVWNGYASSGVRYAVYISATSGSGMRWTRTGISTDGIVYGTFEYLGGADPSYRGAYYKAWDEAETLEV